MSKGRTGIQTRWIRCDDQKYQEPAIKIEINDTETIICEKCEASSFSHSF